MNLSLDNNVNKFVLLVVSGVIVLLAVNMNKKKLGNQVSTLISVLVIGVSGIFGYTLLNQETEKFNVSPYDSLSPVEKHVQHQPVEHLAISRATPNTLVFRPADQTETAEAWEVALGQQSTTTVMALSRQNVPAVRKEYKSANLSARGAYILAEATGKRQAILMATGTEVSLAMEAKALLEDEGIGTRVVSMPCMELFAQQSDAYRKRILPGGAVRVAIEAAVRMGWDHWLLGERGREAKAAFVGMSGFGASAPAERLYEEFGITAEATAKKVKSLL